MWKMVAFVLESAVFALIGLQLRYVLRGLGTYAVGEALGYAVVVFIAVVVVRFIWVYPSTYVPRWLWLDLEEAAAYRESDRV